MCWIDGQEKVQVISILETTGATANTIFSDYYVEDASYLRIQNIQLGYTLNSKVSEK
jgi:hypothetical protein